MTFFVFLVHLNIMRVISNILGSSKFCNCH